ncbi:MAG: sugar ABC transporter ATP-binding protein [Oscillospiraceae bacterium]|nr:sugar ABC transporter ATP-binding protein [Oscillospiraceae bacterium]
MDNNMLLEVKDLSKAFPGVQALDHVSFDLKAGEIHCLIGENGAGKSTLIKCLGGVNIPEEGEIIINGEKVEIHDPLESVEEGIGIIYQEFNLVPSLSVAENIYLAREDTTKEGGFILDRKSMYEKANAILTDIGFRNPDSSVMMWTYRTSQQQMVEIGKALSHDSKIMVFDEPTAVLTERETQNLFDVIKKLRERGIGIIYISHRLDEVLELADRVTALKDGKVTGTVVNEGNLNKDDLVAMMIGRKLEAYYPERYDTVEPDNVVFEVKDLTSATGVFKNINFKLHKGEILGFSGLVGAGRTETMKAILGEYPYVSGEFYLHGEQMTDPSPYNWINKGLAMLPEDRKAEGLVLGMNVAQNISLPNFDKFSKHGIVDLKAQKQFIQETMDKMTVQPKDPNRLAVYFSGGNQQKIILAKWLAKNPDVLILDEPTRGIDVNAKMEIYKIMNDLTTQGISIIMVSSEMNELMGLCDRILVMYEGELCAEFTRDENGEYSEDEIGRAQAGALS